MSQPSVGAYGVVPVDEVVAVIVARFVEVAQAVVAELVDYSNTDRQPLNSVKHHPPSESP